MISTSAIIFEYICPLMGAIVANLMFSGECIAITKTSTDQKQLYSFANVDIIRSSNQRCATGERWERDCPCIYWAHASMISTLNAIPNLVIMIHIIHWDQTAAANIQYVCHYNDIGCEEGYTWTLEPNSLGCHDWYVGACVHVFFISACKIYPIC